MSDNDDLPVQLSELEEGQPITDENKLEQLMKIEEWKKLCNSLTDENLEQLMKTEEWKNLSNPFKKTLLYFFYHPDETERSSFCIFILCSSPKELEDFLKRESVHYVYYYVNKKYETNIIFLTCFFSLLCSGVEIYGIIAGLSLLVVGIIIASPFIYRKFCAKNIIIEREKVLKELNISNIKYLDED